MTVGILAGIFLYDHKFKKHSEKDTENGIIYVEM